MGKKPSPREAPGLTQTQYATLPYKVEEDGNLSLLLVTSRETRRWVIPKGWPMKGKRAHEAAAQEAYEEAGVVGRTERRAIGTYRYWKRHEASFGLCRVEVFPLAVDRLEETWPEQEERMRQWFASADAASIVDEPGLAALIIAFGTRSATRM